MILLEKWLILTPLQKLPKNVGDLGKLIAAKGFKKVAQSVINRPIWSHWYQPIVNADKMVQRVNLPKRHIERTTEKL